MTTTTLATYPDLQVANLSIDPPGSLASGGVVTIHWDDRNAGDKATSSGWTETVAIKNTTTGETLASVPLVYDPATAGSGNIGPGTSRSRQYVYQLPDGTRGIGQIQVTVTTDSGNSVFENNAGGTAETNNSSSLTASSVVGPYPDIQITGLAIDPTAGLQSGGSLTVRWNDNNSGTRATQGSWYDRVTIKNTTTGETLDTIAVPYVEATSGNGPIAAGGSRARQWAYTLPSGTRRGWKYRS